MRLQTRKPPAQTTSYVSDVSVICFYLGRKGSLVLFELNPGDGSVVCFCFSNSDCVITAAIP